MKICPECGAEMHSPITNVTLGEKLWKCPKCGYREIERINGSKK